MHVTDADGLDANESLLQDNGLDWQNDDTHDLSVILQRLTIIYSWAGHIFSALDLESKGLVDLNRSGPALFSIFSELKISHLWDLLQKLVNGEATMSPQRFVAVFFLWMGIDEQFELSCQQGVCIPKVVFLYACMYTCAPKDWLQ